MYKSFLDCPKFRSHCFPSWVARREIQLSSNLVHHLLDFFKFNKITWWVGFKKYFCDPIWLLTPRESQWVGARRGWRGHWQLRLVGHEWFELDGAHVRFLSLTFTQLDLGLWRGGVALNCFPQTLLDFLFVLSSEIIKLQGLFDSERTHLDSSLCFS